ncbi:MAG: HAD-IC family P-type ATPase, partial [Candidatus Aureabacteria bacterium]|nr:HAD-IC family P-type ATPase [Candidatus Auribacterota bacterium]
VLGLAYKITPAGTDNLSEDLVNDLVLVGVVGMIDPPRPQVKEAIAKAEKAGIRVIMKTGDHKDTAVAIAKEIGMIGEKVESKFPEVLTEQDLLKLSKEEFEETIKHISVFARLTPAMKLRIVETLQKQGHIVAMTGDGVNDAPALKKADIGIAMGIIGTDVARESSDIVLADDNFSSIMNAIEEGRTVFTNTRQASAFLITTNFAESISIITTLLLGLPLPLLPSQLLWLNLVTDGVTDVALAAEPSHEDVLEELPRKAKENILSKEIIPFMLIMAGIMVILTLIIFNAYLPGGIGKARTGAFTVMAFTQLFNVLNMRSLKRSIFKIGLFSNKFIVASLIASVVLLAMVLYVPFFQGVFQFVPLSLLEILAIVLFSSSVLWSGELYKYLKNK